MTDVDGNRVRRTALDGRFAERGPSHRAMIYRPSLAGCLSYLPACAMLRYLGDWQQWGLAETGPIGDLTGPPSHFALDAYGYFVLSAVAIG
jgi:hypothetical protein